jgi:hypothetical protein
MYQLIKSPITGELMDCVKRLIDNAYIPFDPANTDYQQFKQAINDPLRPDTAQLQDADGNTMSAEDAKQFVASLP